MKHLVLLFILWLFLMQIASAQIKWRDDSVPFSEVEWNNYSTTYIGNDFDKVPKIITAIPYNGVYDMESNKELDMSFSGSNFQFQSNLSNVKQHLVTYDSGNVYFLTPGIFKKNTSLYEYRIMDDAKGELKPWSIVSEFTEGDFTVNNFKTNFGYLGGYKTYFDHSLLVELRRKKDKKVIALTTVIWQQTQPMISNIYTSSDLNEFLKELNRPWDRTLQGVDAKRWKRYDSINGLDTTGTLPEKLMLEPDESSIIFFISASVYQKEALEYSLVKDGKIIVDWKPNDFDNNLIWLQKLEHGDYVIKMRFRKQRHNVTSYPFRIKAYWYQTKTFYYAMLFLGSLLIGFIIVFILNKRKLNREKRLTEQLQLEQKSVRAQLNPHFTFNALSSIQSLMNGNKIEKANFYFTQFSSLLRDSLRNNEKEMLPLQIELQTLEQYIKLEQLRFGFACEIIVANNINTSTVEVPSLLLQPLVENAIKHGISHLQDEGNIVIEITERNKNIIIAIKDNGRGFSPQHVHAGYGLSLTKERIRLFNQSRKDEQIQMNINSSENGTTLTLQFTNWL